MTKLRKLTSLLLAGALTLLFLTACSGGGGSSSPEAQAEAEVMGAINKGRTMALSNDPDMQEVAKARLDDLDAKLKFNAFGYTVFNKVDAKWDADNQNATLTLVAKNMTTTIPRCRRSSIKSKATIKTKPWILP